MKEKEQHVAYTRPLVAIKALMKNILNNWKEKNLAKTFKTPSGVKTVEPIVEFIYSSLTSIFGLDYFEIDPKNAEEVGLRIDIEKTNLLHTLLHVENFSAILQLLEFCKVLSFYQSKHPEIIRDLIKLGQSSKGFRQFRDLYFELFIFYVLEINQIKHQVKPFEGKKELEGVIHIDDNEILFECKKIYSTKSKILKSAFGMLKELSQELIRQKIPSEGLIVCYDLSTREPLKEDQLRQFFKESLRRFRNDAFYFKGHFPNEAEREVSIYLYSEPVFNQLRNIENKDRVLTKIYPEIKRSKKEKAIFKVEHTILFGVREDEIIQHFLNKLRKKRRNRRDSSFTHRVYFFEFETIRTLDMSLMQFSISPRIISSIQEYLDKKNDNSIVCIVEKVIINDQYQIKPIWICRDQLNDLARELGKIDFLIL